MDFWHALATGVLIAVIFGIVEKSGVLEGKSFWTKMLLLLPVYFVAVLVLNLLWPGSP